jgi:hypothetical protein
MAAAGEAKVLLLPWPCLICHFQLVVSLLGGLPATGQNVAVVKEQ